MSQRQTVTKEMPSLQAQIQFAEMLVWMGKGWGKLPKGCVCPHSDCGGALWFKMEQNGRFERHKCSHCGWTQRYAVG